VTEGNHEMSSHRRVLIVFLAVGLLAGTRPIEAQPRNWAWAIGARAEYVALSGEQFDGITDGLGFNAFVGFPIGRRTDLEIGIWVTRHQQYLLCPERGAPCDLKGEFVVPGIYLQPTFRAPFSNAALVAYAAPRIGMLGCDCQDGWLGLDIGAVGGVLFPVSERASLEASLVGTVAYVGTPPGEASRGLLGRRAALRFGLVICFDKQGMSLSCGGDSV
jgi:hypothetical protein